MAKAEWAAWMQAAFSVIAIVAATLIASHQSRHAVRLQAQLRREDALRQMDIAIALASRAVWLLEKAPDPSTSDEAFQEFWKVVSVRDFEFAANDLRKLGPEHVPRGTVLTQATSLAHQLEAACAIMQSMYYSSFQTRTTRREVWNKVAEPIGEIRDLAVANRAVLLSIREHC